MALHPQAEILIDLAEKSGLPPIDTLNVDDARAHYDLRANGLEAEPNIGEVIDRTIPGPGGDLPIRIYRPVDAGDATPCLMFFHGGGWVIGTVDTHDLACRALTEATDATVVSVEYRLAPEHPFPAAPDDCTAATKWVAENGAEIGVDGSRIAVCGDSAGGNLSAVVAQDCADGGPRIAAQALVYPATDFTDQGRESLVANGEGYLLTAAAMKWFADHYVPEEVELGDVRLSPIFGELAGLPPAIVFTAEYDPLVDEGKDYADALSAAGVEVDYSMYEGQVHTFFTQVGFMDASLDAINRIAEFLNAHW